MGVTATGVAAELISVSVRRDAVQSGVHLHVSITSTTHYTTLVYPASTNWRNTTSGNSNHPPFTFGARATLNLKTRSTLSDVRSAALPCTAAAAAADRATRSDRGCATDASGCNRKTYKHVLLLPLLPLWSLCMLLRTSKHSPSSSWSPDQNRPVDAVSWRWWRWRRWW